MLAALLFILVSITSSYASSVGVCYGRNSANTIPTDKVVQVLQSHSIVKLRLLTYNFDLLRALSNTGVQVIVGVADGQIRPFAESEATASDWVERNINQLLPDTDIVGISVGSEVITGGSGTSQYLVAAMWNINSGLARLGLNNRIKVSSPNSMGVLGVSFPPSSGSFDDRYTSVIEPMLEFLSRTNSYLMANVYPYYSYRNQREYITADFAMLRPNPGFDDPNTGLHYWNMFDAQLDALYYAMGRYGHPELDVLVSETGWPSMGDPDEVDVVNLENAAEYVNNLVKHLDNCTGTPSRPGSVPETYVFELFNEDHYRNWGLFKPDGTEVYGLYLGDDGNGVIQLNRTYCIAKPGSSFTDLQAALDWACGPGNANCTDIQHGGDCYLPDNVFSHASYAFNDYFHKNSLQPSACSFSGTATVTTIDPSYGSCIYRGSLLQGRASTSRHSLLLAVASIIFLRLSLT